MAREVGEALVGKPAAWCAATRATLRARLGNRRKFARPRHQRDGADAPISEDTAAELAREQ